VTATGAPSEIERFIAAAIKTALAEKKVEVDAVVHGLFDDENPIPRGEFTVEDAWKVIPYENLLVTAELTPSEIQIMLEEMFNTRYNNRNLLGLRAVVGEKEDPKNPRYPKYEIAQLTTAEGKALDPKKRYRIALNSYDAQSGGQRFLTLLDLLEKPEAKTMLHEIMTRDALMTLVSSQGKINKDVLL
jgi:2',3'-cyclic-nucleotide 2'-phosphodiesterase (5'-nucleotidase family)